MKLYVDWCSECQIGLSSSSQRVCESHAERHALNTAYAMSRMRKPSTLHKMYLFEFEIDLPMEVGALISKEGT